MATTTISLVDARQLVVDVFGKAGMPAPLAEHAARALVMAEQEGLPSHGLARAPFYAAQMVTGKVVADAAPTVTRDGAVIRVDAGFGLAFAAIDAAALAARDVVRELGVAVVSVTRSHHFGVAGQAVEPFAREGFARRAIRC